MTQPILNRILADVTRRHGERADISEITACDAAIILAYDTKQRVRVRNTRTGHERTGVVSRTTGWRPALLLMHRSNAHGSWDLLGPDDRIIAVWNGQRYV